MREPLLRDVPEAQAVSLAELVGLAHAIEAESVRRYAALARTMRQRGEQPTAAAFEAMADEERAHARAVEHWAEGLGQAVPAPEPFVWRLPAEIGASWDEAVNSALLNPYRAFSIAVDNEQRAFAFYAYVAAHCDDARVARQAEVLALEELRHAALLRRWRRAAWHAARGAPAPRAAAFGSAAEIQRFVAERREAIGALHARIAARLHALGEHRAVAALDAPLAESARPAVTAGLPATREALLTAALAPLEELAERLELTLATAQGEVFEAAQAALEEVVRRIAPIAALMHR